MNSERQSSKDACQTYIFLDILKVTTEQSSFIDVYTRIKLKNYELYIDMHTR